MKRVESHTPLAVLEREKRKKLPLLKRLFSSSPKNAKRKRGRQLPVDKSEEKEENPAIVAPGKIRGKGRSLSQSNTSLEDNESSPSAEILHSSSLRPSTSPADRAPGHEGGFLTPGQPRKAPDRNKRYQIELSPDERFGFSLLEKDRRFQKFAFQNLPGFQLFNEQDDTKAVLRKNKQLMDHFQRKKKALEANGAWNWDPHPWFRFANPDLRLKFGQDPKRCRFTGARDGRRVFCSNTVLKHPVFNTFLPYCGYHTKRCVKVDDHVGKPPLIQHPNEFGMCRLHYTAVFHKQPKSHTITTVPGIISTDEVNAKHPLAPLPPVKNRFKKQISSLSSRPQVNPKMGWNRYRKLRKKAATDVQRVIRGFLVRIAARRLKDKQRKYRRHTSAIRIQTVWKRHNARIMKDRLFQRLSHAAQVIQGAYIRYRKILRFQWLKKLVEYGIHLNAAAVQIQRRYRRKLTERRIRSHIIILRARKRRKVYEKLAFMLLRFLAKFRHRIKEREKRKFATNSVGAAVKLQRWFRRMYTKYGYLQHAEHERRRMRARDRIKYFLKAYLARWRLKRQKRAALHIQRIWQARRLLRLEKLRQKKLLEWLQLRIPSTLIEKQRARNRLRMPTGSSKPLRTSLQAQSEEQKALCDAMEAMLEKSDVRKEDRIVYKQFARVMRYRNIVSLFRNHGRSCTLHRTLLCIECIGRGDCTRCDCSAFIERSVGVCQCTHLLSSHSVISFASKSDGFSPDRKTKFYAVTSKQNLDRILRSRTWKTEKY